MTAPTDQFVDIAKQSQQAVTAAVRTWADTVQAFAGSLTGGQPKLPDMHAVVDNYFDFVQQMLDNQRRFAQSMLSAGSQAAETITEQAARAAESVTTHAENATEAVVQASEQTSRFAGEQATANARAAKNATSKI